MWKCVRRCVKIQRYEDRGWEACEDIEMCEDGRWKMKDERWKMKVCKCASLGSVCAKEWKHRNCSMELCVANVEEVCEGVEVCESLSVEARESKRCGSVEVWKSVKVEDGRWKMEVWKCGKCASR